MKKKIRLTFHMGKENVTASTRNFIKPPLAEEMLTFVPDITTGYQADPRAKPPTQLSLFLLLEQQMKDETESLKQIREIEDQVREKTPPLFPRRSWVRIDR